MNDWICTSTRLLSQGAHKRYANITYGGRDAGELRPEVEAAVLPTVVRGDVLNGGVADVADSKHSGGSCSADRAEIVREGENGPAVGDGAELGVGSVRESAVVDELRADDGVLASLPGSALSLLIRDSLENISCYTEGGTTYVQSNVVGRTLCISLCQRTNSISLCPYYLRWMWSFTSLNEP